MGESTREGNQRPATFWTWGRVQRADALPGLIIVLSIVAATVLIALALLPWRSVLLATPVFALVLAAFSIEAWAPAILAWFKGTKSAEEDAPFNKGWRNWLALFAACCALIYYQSRLLSGMFGFAFGRSLLIATPVSVFVLVALFIGMRLVYSSCSRDDAPNRPPPTSPPDEGPPTVSRKP